MINRDNSVFCPHLALPLHLWAMRSSYWLSLSPTLHFVSVSGSLRDRRARQSYKVKYFSPGSSSFSNYPPGGILAVLDNNGSPGVCLSPLKCGWRKPTRGTGQRNVCFSVMPSEEHKSKANLYCSLLHNSSDFLLLNTWHTLWNPFSCGWDNETCSPKAIMRFEIKHNY